MSVFSSDLVDVVARIGVVGNIELAGTLKGAVKRIPAGDNWLYWRSRGADGQIRSRSSAIKQLQRCR
jgi:hypothetical protein